MFINRNYVPPPLPRPPPPRSPIPAIYARPPTNNQDLCMDDGGSYNGGPREFLLYACNSDNQNQHYQYRSETKQVYNPTKNICAQVVNNSRIYGYPCDSNNNAQKFNWDGDRFTKA